MGTLHRTPLRRALLYLFTSMVLAFLFLPSFIVIPFSVSYDSTFVHLQFPPREFTWYWYEDYFYPLTDTGCCQFGSGPRWWLYKTFISFELTVLVAVFAVPIGALAAYGLSRGRFLGRNLLNAFILSPLIVPVMITAVALFFFMSNSLPSFLESPAGLSVPVWGEYALIFLAISLGVASIGLLLLKKFYRKPMVDWDPKLLLWYGRLRPWALLVLLLTAAYIMLPWLSMWASPDRRIWYEGRWLYNWLFNPRDPYPPVPVPSAGLLLGHVMLALPYVTIILVAAFRNVERTQDRAAAILGAGPIASLTRVVLPQVKPGLALSVVFAALVSFNDVLIGLFLSTSQISTLPQQIYWDIRTEISPTIAAISTILVSLTVILLGLAFFGSRRSDAAKARPALPLLGIAHPKFRGQ